MMPIRILLVEDNARWRKILRTHITSAVSEAEVCQATTFQAGSEILKLGGLSLLVTDIGLPPASDHVFGIQLVEQAFTEKVPCIVVSGTESVTKQHVRDLLLEYQAKDFFTKEELRSSPNRQRDFRELIRRWAVANSPLGTVGKTVSEPQQTHTPGTTRIEEARTVTVGRSGNGIYLKSAGLPNYPIPKGFPTNVFLLFAKNIADGLPDRVVDNKVLNQTIAEEGLDKAHQTLRDVMHDLREGLRNWSGMREKDWFRPDKKQGGYRLESIVKWEVEPGQEADFRDPHKVYLLLADPLTLQTNTPNRDQRLPAKPMRKPVDEDND
jgi:CheY-like chemotaxis protein